MSKDDINISHGSVAQHFRCGGKLIIPLSQIYRWVFKRQNFDNCSTSDDKNLVA